MVHSCLFKLIVLIFKTLISSWLVRNLLWLILKLLIKILAVSKQTEILNLINGLINFFLILNINLFIYLRWSHIKYKYHYLNININLYLLLTFNKFSDMQFCKAKTSSSMIWFDLVVNIYGFGDIYVMMKVVLEIF